MSDAAAIPSSLLNATIEHLSRFAPFAEMGRADLEWMVERLALSYTPKDGIVLDPALGPVEHFYVIKQGSVVSERLPSADAAAEAHTQLLEGECFPLGALLAKRPVANVFRAVVDTFCYRLSAADFAALMRRSHPFQDFCTRRIAHLLERSKQQIQAQYTQAGAAQQPLSMPLGELVRRTPVSCTPDTPIKDALARLHAENVGSIVIAQDAGPLGIFTVHDLLTRVALAGQDTAVPISTVMTPAPVSLPRRASAYEAAMAMARHGIRHVLVLEGARCVGVVSERDLFSLQRVGLTQISTDVRNAHQVSDLAAIAADIRALAQSMLAQGIGAEQLTQLVSMLNDLLVARIVELEQARFDLVGIEWCWLALGSEGRVEQTLATDQDNGIVFAASAPDANAMRERLLPFARAVNAALDACGFPLCKGEIMAGNPRWCLSLGEWQDVFATWIEQGDPQALLHASIFFDFRPLAGSRALAEQLRQWLAPRAKANRRFLHQLAANALRNRPPLGVVRDFVLESKGEYVHTIDLKLNGTTPFIDAARIYSLAAEDTHTNTLQRLRAASVEMKIPSEEVEAWAEAFLFIQLLRLRSQHRREAKGKPMHNHVDPDELNELERRILKEAFRQARKLQQRLALDYGL
jgi:CBS domain-containing protein